MEEVFYDLYKVHPRLVTDVHQYIYKVSGMNLCHEFSHNVIMEIQI